MALAAEDEAARITVVLADGSTEEREAAYASLESTVCAAENAHHARVSHAPRSLAARAVAPTMPSRSRGKKGDTLVQWIHR